MHFKKKEGKKLLKRKRRKTRPSPEHRQLVPVSAVYLPDQPGINVIIADLLLALFGQELFPGYCQASYTFVPPSSMLNGTSALNGTPAAGKLWLGFGNLQTPALGFNGYDPTTQVVEFLRLNDAQALQWLLFYAGTSLDLCFTEGSFDALVKDAFYYHGCSQQVLQLLQSFLVAHINGRKKQVEDVDAYRLQVSSPLAVGLESLFIYYLADAHKELCLGLKEELDGIPETDFGLIFQNKLETYLQGKLGECDGTLLRRFLKLIGFADQPEYLAVIEFLMTAGTKLPRTWLFSLERLCIDYAICYGPKALLKQARFIFSLKLRAIAELLACQNQYQPEIVRIQRNSVRLSVGFVAGDNRQLFRYSHSGAAREAGNDVDVLVVRSTAGFVSINCSRPLHLGAVFSKLCVQERSAGKNRTSPYAPEKIFLHDPGFCRIQNITAPTSQTNAQIMEAVCAGLIVPIQSVPRKHYVYGGRDKRVRHARAI